MEGKESLCKLLRSLTDLDIHMSRDLLMDYLMGHQTMEITQRGLDNTENYGCGDDKEEDHWALVIDQATEEGYLKVRSDGLSAMAKGKKYLKKPVSFKLKDEEEEEQYDGKDIDGLVDEVLIDGVSVKGEPRKTTKSSTSHRKLELIQAVDRHVALDDFASNHGYDFDDVLSDVESILESGTKMDLNYFGLEVLGEEAIDELTDYFNSAKTDNLDKAFNEYGDVYTYDELRLGRIIWLANKL